MPELPALTGLRFFAAFSIILNHLLLGFVDKNNPYFATMLSACGILGMNIFFILSGFIIHYNYHYILKDFSLRSFYEFYVARLSRLYPLFFFALLLEIATSDYVLHYGCSYMARILPYFLTLTQSWFFIRVDGNLLAHILPRMSISWSISTELFFYLAYPIILYGLTKDRLNSLQRSIIIIWLCLALSWGLSYLYNDPVVGNFIGEKLFGVNGGGSQENSFSFWFSWMSPYTRIFEFIMGVYISHLYLKFEGVPVSLLEQYIVPFFGILGFSFIILTFIPEAYELPYINLLQRNFGYYPAVALIIFTCARYTNACLTSFFSLKPFVAFGEWSYSLYLFHIFILHVVTYGAGPAWLQFFRIMIYFTLVIGAAKILFTYVEMPCRRSMRSWLLQFFTRFMENKNRYSQV